MQDFLEFNNLAQQEYQATQQMAKTKSQQVAQHTPMMRDSIKRAFMILFAIGKEALGDAHKKMKQHKQALSRYEEAISDIDSARRLKDPSEAHLVN